MKVLYFRLDPRLKQEALYREALGDDALARQRVEAEARHECCGAPIATGHHPLCAEVEPPGEIEGQERLL